MVCGMTRCIVLHVACHGMVWHLVWHVWDVMRKMTLQWHCNIYHNSHTPHRQAGEVHSVGASACGLRRPITIGSQQWQQWQWREWERESH
jgi:hypothetical protein